jgi:EAL domain-containing protein (putative c-di-GMP-specific phosphodiesterase class I)
VRCFDEPVVIDGVEHYTSCAVGYVLSTGDRTRSFEEMLQEADIAMYQAKSSHEHHAVAYDRGLEAKTQAKRTLESELRLALANHELFVEYQPLVDAANHKIVSAEALVRWHSPERGLVGPMQFIPIAEASGLIHDIGDYVLTRVCEDIRHLPGLALAVNVSPSQLKDPDFVDRFTKIVRDHGVEPSRIEIEVTENVVIENLAVVSRRFEVLKAAGFKLSLDDFGMGFSSVGYLQRLSFQKLKVDRSFVAEIGNGDKQNKLLQSLALLSEALNLTVVAEGVEREEQAKLLKLLNFDLLQGWFAGRPMSIEALRDRLARDAVAKVA